MMARGSISPPYQYPAVRVSPRLTVAVPRTRGTNPLCRASLGWSWRFGDDEPVLHHQHRTRNRPVHTGERAALDAYLDRSAASIDGVQFDVRGTAPVAERLADQGAQLLGRQADVEVEEVFTQCLFAA